MVFYELPSAWKTFFLALLLLFILFQFSYVALLTQHNKRGTAAVHLLILLGLGMTIPFLAENMQVENVLGIHLQFEYLILFYSTAWAIYIFLFLKEYRSGERILGLNAVKEAMDQLPVAICIFTTDGLPVLCNMKMYSLAYDLLGKDLQLMSELRACLETPNESIKRVYLGEEPAFLLLDQSVWHFSRIDMKDQSGKEYIQMIGSDVTSLYRLQNELDQRNDELQEMLQKIQNISENIADIVRSKEILSAKERVHGKMGSSLLVAKSYLSESPEVRNKAQFLEIWKETLDSLRNEMEEDEGNSAFEEMIQIAKGIGVSIHIDGVLPEDERLYEIITCGLREMLTNVVRHAAGHHLYLAITYDRECMQAVYTNDGIAPEREIVEGGGLSMLRRKIEQNNGIMNIQSVPNFSLTIIMKLNHKKL